ncbi:ZIP family metal transporter [Dactylosporangium sp. CA-052675]|uniref:ZIP family metal transporter n=1 Tax=Dactylosporangium sp. CA-052675 TaxID=3239927 RepID=UPI003D92DF75
MSATNIAVLGAIAGFTILLGLPIGRLRNPAPRLRALLNAGAVGVLLFLLWDVLAHAWEPVDTALGKQDYAPAVSNGLVLAAGIGLGLLGLVYFDRWVARRGVAHPTAPTATPRSDNTGGVASGGDRAEAAGLHGSAGQLALLIAVGVGLHNFAEGLAIGSSAASGEIALAVLLIVGFGLHNATEGFGIVAPLAAAGARPSWGYLTVLGLIGGGPTLLGTLVGQRFTNDTVSVAFLALAAGSILYVVIELLAVGRRMAAKEITTWGLLLGLLTGFLTDAVVTAGGA